MQNKLLKIFGASLAFILAFGSAGARIARADDGQPVDPSADMGLDPAINQLPTKGQQQSSYVRIYPTTEQVRAGYYGNQTNAAVSNLTYHNGPIMPSVRVYAIYWLPSGYTMATGYQTLLNRYFTDVNGSAFYNINTQYYQGSTTKTYMQNVSSFAGSWTDTLAYPGGRGTKTSPLTDADIRNEVTRAIQQNGWTANGNTQFMVFTAKGVESCYNSTSCTPGTAHPAYCAYHSSYTLSGASVIYANMPYGATWGTSCRSFSVSPNGNMDADMEISTASHEHFEAATDPFGSAWYDRSGNENGDKCAYNYGTIGSNGSNMTMGGNPYIIQQEWNNSRSACSVVK